MSVNVKKFYLAGNCLPSCPIERRNYLDNYFDDLLASVEPFHDGWNIDLNWPSTADYYIDPDLTSGLDWWSPGINVGDIRKQVSRSSDGQLSLNDSWTLYGWSQWLKKRRDCGEPTNEVTILHVDDHTDLMTPRLILSTTRWCDAITGDVFDIYKPETVSSAILSGAVGVGSFMSPFIHSIPLVQLRHLSQTAPKNISIDHRISATTFVDTILQPSSFRPSIAVYGPEQDAPTEAVSRNTSRYRFTRCLKHWLYDLPNAPVLLHIDMDYFNNRFNGDSDWEMHVSRLDPPLEEILESIDGLFDEIAASGVASLIEDVTIGLSPGFFPAEFWKPSIARLNENLMSLGFMVEVPSIVQRHSRRES